VRDGLLRSDEGAFESDGGLLGAEVCGGEQKQEAEMVSAHKTSRMLGLQQACFECKWRRMLEGMAKMGELALIELIRERAGKAKGAVRLGIGDDCAILAPKAGEEVVVTTDFSLEGRHFKREWHPMVSVGHRVLARGLSDLAAMGAKPMAAFLSLALPGEFAKNRGEICGLLDGVLWLAMEASVVLAGGDTSESPSNHILADIVLLGSVPRGKALRRSGARVGDILYCTGSLGGAAVELEMLAKAPGKFRRAKVGGDHPHLFPAPRLKAGQALVKRGLATACMDISDGISTDLGHLCEASGVGAELEAGLLPLHPLAKALSATDGLHAALHGGEDYELLFTAKASVNMPKMLGGVVVTKIGKIVAKSKGVVLLGVDGKRSTLKPQGWEHLR
jgi:thiamine-monophosphate kinase